jgi:serine/threonine protein kinase
MIIGLVQKCISELGLGISGVVYEVDEQTILKAPWIIKRPNNDSPFEDHHYYETEALLRFDNFENERAIFRRLEHEPHPNIVQAIALEHDEGIYLRRHQPISHCQTPPQSGQILWYQDMLRGLLHLHQIGIAHSDIRLDNFLCDTHGRVLLCDFSCSRPFSGENPSATEPGEALCVNGPAQTVCDSTDRFALVSVIFQMELGTKPQLSLVSCSTTVHNRI